MICYIITIALLLNSAFSAHVSVRLIVTKTQHNTMSA